MKGRKGLALAIVSKLPAPGKKGYEGKGKEEPEPEGEGEEDTDVAGKESAARALIRAIESNNPREVVEAFEDLAAMCG